MSNLEKKQELKEKANMEFLFGILFIIGGIGLTAITGGTFIFYGAVLYGVWLVLKGIWHKMCSFI